MIFQIKTLAGAHKAAFSGPIQAVANSTTMSNELGAVTITEKGSGYTFAEVQNPKGLIGTSALSGSGTGADLLPVLKEGISSVTVDDGGGYNTTVPKIRVSLSGYEVETAPALTATVTSNAVSAVAVTTEGKFTPIGGLEQSISLAFERYLRSITISDGGAYDTAPTLTLVLGGYEVETAPTATATLSGDAIDSITISEEGEFYPKPGVGQQIDVIITRDGSDTMTDDAVLVPVITTDPQLSLATTYFLTDVEVVKSGGDFTGTPVLTLNSPAGMSTTAATASFALVAFAEASINVNGTAADYHFKGASSFLDKVAEAGRRAKNEALTVVSVQEDF